VQTAGRPDELTLAGLAPDARRALDELATAVSLEPRLRKLVEIRTAQVNGCATSLERHLLDAVALGERTGRLVAVGDWRSSTVFSERERAALELADALALLPRGAGARAAGALAETPFADDELAQLVAACIAASAWDRLATATGELPEARAA
jgi:AhpD family alkylhydroperoxidase